MDNGHADQAERALRLVLLLDRKRLSPPVVLSAADASEIQAALEDARNAHRALAVLRATHQETE
jgi:hypothetical protein